MAKLRKKSTKIGSVEAYDCICMYSSGVCNCGCSCGTVSLSTMQAEGLAGNSSASVNYQVHTSLINS